MRTIRAVIPSCFFAAILLLINIFCYDTAYALDETHQQKIVYLTFDDGPVPIVTDRILDVLRAENVKATFFVVGKEIETREEILKRIYEEGHTIGLHTYTHNFNKLYRNPEMFISEMLKERELINGLLDINPTVVRFPGGSAGRMTQDLLDKLHSNEMKVFDWNVDLEDGIHGEMSVRQIVENGTKLNAKYSRIIILAHTNSNNLNTAKALPEIIKYYKNLGYEFAPIDDGTKEYYYRIKGKNPKEPSPVQNIKK